MFFVYFLSFPVYVFTSPVPMHFSFSSSSLYFATVENLIN
jgi:hypothetical protein